MLTLEHPLRLVGLTFKPRPRTDYIAIHCADTPAKMDIGAYEIDRWHRERGWLCIGYHYVIRRDGRIECGRPQEVIGAHVEGYNHLSVGVCWVGGRKQGKDDLPEDNRTPEQLVSMLALVYQLKLEYPTAVVQGHRDFPNVTKYCPSFDAKAWWAGTKEAAT